MEQPIKGLGSSALLALILNSHFEVTVLEQKCSANFVFLMQSLFIYVEFTTSNTKYTNIIFHCYN